MNMKYSIQKILLFSILSLIIFSCGGSNPAPTRDFGSNILHQSFIEISSNEYFLPQENAVKILTANNSNIKISESLQIEDKFSKILGNKNVIYLQKANEIAVLKKKEKEDGYEEVAEIKNIAKCDMMALGQDFLAIASGNMECSNGLNSKVSFYETSDISKPTFKFSVNTNPPTSIKTYYKMVFVAEGSKGFRILEFDGKNKPTELYKNETKTANQIFYYPTNKTLIVKNETEVLQYTIDDVTKPTLLSTIKIGN